MTSPGSSTTQMRRGVAALVLADAAARLVGQVEAHLAQPDALLDLADGVGQRGGVLGVAAQDVEGQALGRALADAGQLAQLGDQPLDGRRIQALEARQAQRAQVHAAGEAAEPGLLRAPGRRAAPRWWRPGPCPAAARDRRGRWPPARSSIDLTTRSPETLTVTIPPPAEASTSSCLSCSWAASMSCCIFWTCLSICCMFGGCGIRAGPPARRVADRRGRSPRRRTPS